MNILHKYSLIFQANKEVVFEHFADLSNFAYLFKHIISIEKEGLPDGKKSDKHYTEVARNFLGVKEQILLRIDSQNSPNQITVLTNNKRTKSGFQFNFEEIDNSNSKIVVSHFTEHQVKWQIFILKILIPFLFHFRIKHAQKQASRLFK